MAHRGLGKAVPQPCDSLTSLNPASLLSISPLNILTMSGPTIHAPFYVTSPDIDTNILFGSNPAISALNTIFRPLS